MGGASNPCETLHLSRRVSVVWPVPPTVNYEARTRIRRIRHRDTLGRCCDQKGRTAVRRGCRGRAHRERRRCASASIRDACVPCPPGRCTKQERGAIGAADSAIESAPGTPAIPGSTGGGADSDGGADRVRGGRHESEPRGLGNVADRDRNRSAADGSIQATVWLPAYC